MAKSNNAPKNNNADQSKPQPLGVFVVDERSQDRKFWTRVGAAWAHEDGKGYNLEIVPGISVSGRLVIRERKQDEAQD